MQTKNPFESIFDDELRDLGDVFSTYLKSSNKMQTSLSSHVSDFQVMDQSQQNKYLLHLMIETRNEVRNLKEDVAWMRNIIRKNMQNQDILVSNEIPDNYDMTPEQIKEMILEKIGVDKPFYPSDFAIEQGLDFEAVIKAIEMLRQEGRIIE